ncbi:histidine phosphatase family protein [Gammaproteobacteria bacterium]|nr:histidine phosphatase family protein [Gammaproteobacteria bacterium]
MKNLFLLRHAKSSWSDPSKADFHRPLSKRGISNALSLSKYISQHQIIFDLILSSPSERTQATLDLIFTEKDFLSKIKFQEAIYHAEMSTLLELIKDQNNLKKNILVIGHNPGLHLLIEHLTKTFIEKFPTCSFVKLSNFDSWKDLDANILDLKFFVTPRDLIHD